MLRRTVTLDDKFDLSKDLVFVSGTQAIVRLALMQRARDRRLGLHTAGYVTGYRGSPIGGLDQQFWKAEKLLAPNDIRFQSGVNEDLAATALWGTQQAEMRGEGRYDGVFGLWYGKGPGVDRTGDVFRHANSAGSSRHGGVLALMGDDHTCESSTVAHQSEFAFVDAMIPILNPAGVQEILDYGLYGWALSRFAGTWAGLKCMKDNIESTAVVDGSLDRVSIVIPEFEMPPGGLNIRPGVHPLEQERLLHLFKIPAARAFVRANGLDRIAAQGGPRARLGVVSVGKSWLDTLAALDLLGIDEVRAADLGLRLYKVAVPWPLEPEGAARFAHGLETILVVEEKRALIETQLKEQLYGRANAPIVAGKTDERGAPLFRAHGALEALEIALAIGRRILAYAPDAAVAARMDSLESARRTLDATTDVAVRTPHFCSGCPHNSSTHVPDGSRAYAGIGCHYMVQWMDRATDGYTQMGGEGANWIGEAPFSKRDHVFQNLGDGTYEHSGYLAIRAAAAAGVNITYKILYNDAVAMTGGQPNDAGLSVDAIARQVAAQGARRIAIVSDEPDKYAPELEWPAGTTFHHRSALDQVQREMREVKGLSILIYDQTCASEKRRRRKRGAFPDPDRRVVINSLVCEGCGDCGTASNCVSVQPLQTEFGRKRTIEQSSCNKDFSCLEGFCPSFVTVHGAKLKSPAPVTALPEPVPEPALLPLTRRTSILITGVGGTGVVTIGAVLGMAAHLDGYGVGIIDMAGLAQKGGAVTTHIKIAPRAEDIHAIRVAPEEADVVLACDIVVAGSKKVLAAMRPGASRVYVNTHETFPGDFTRDPDFSLPTRRLMRAIEGHAGPGRARFVEAQRLATRLMGDAIAANMFMVGYAWQQGGIPLSREAILEAIRMNGVARRMNADAFEWGRRAAHDLASVEQAAGADAGPPAAEDLAALVARRTAFLADYQDRAYAERYRRRVERVAAAERRLGLSGVAEEVARSLFKLMAIKDEYEVARLYTDGAFERQLAETFASWEKLEFHLAPPALARRDPQTGHPRKQSFGPWMLRAFRVLAAMRGLRGTFADPFGRTAERRWERKLLSDYEAIVDRIARELDREKHEAALALAAYPRKIRGFGHVKERQAAVALKERDLLLARFAEGPAAAFAEAAE
ncbi:indolepyruvate ferredoxin oxidoreductase family protein [Propylenella binzhouense]|uniref:Indolepyruvate ferredoxin oxidoreductase family protein n=1 Tax=Propylenella binzhouense TaxID=2555902 RepID=A0A964T4I6_9HYPH|nr:indolepyruvate ferredoxin oxidoreductase family protein [Propylenella binzhouense]MYZ48240.1 indolepyruvate ferredoxin oxidoreductase family protein [Propylenella binzhouense]